MDEKQKQEMKEKAKAVAMETAQKTKEVGKAAAAKADELYNKLPLDKINEKLGGKVDVKSKKFKIIVSIVICIMLLFIIKMLFSSHDIMKTNKTVFSEIPEDNIKVIYALSDQDLKEYWAVFQIASRLQKKNNIYYPHTQKGKKPMECVDILKKYPDFKDYKKLLEEEYKIQESIKDIRKSLRDSVLQIHQDRIKAANLAKERDKRCKILAKGARDVLNKAMDESYDTCKKIEVTHNDFFHQADTREWYKGRAFIYNSRTGKTRERSVEMWIDTANGSIYAKLE
ncbi:MAG: hypothetical protein J5858_05050 [Lentisphaeria bacterium]|nr:hypothetical protein [Lentisphaeria bacterium]